MKSISKILFLFVSVLLLLGCSVRKKTTDKERIRIERDTIRIHDSIYITKDRIVHLPSVNTSSIPNPCDESGKLNVIDENIKFPYGNVNINSDDKGNLKIQVNTDSINSVYERQYEQRNKKQVQQITDLQKEVTLLKVTPFNWWQLIGIISIVVNILLGIILVIIVIKNKLVKWK